MNHQHDLFDSELENWSEDELIDDDGFSAQVMKRIRRREAFLLILYRASLVVCGFLLCLLCVRLLEDPALNEFRIDVAHVFAFFMGAGILTIFLMDSEEFSF